MYDRESNRPLIYHGTFNYSPSNAVLFVTARVASFVTKIVCVSDFERDFQDFISTFRIRAFCFSKAQWIEIRIIRRKLFGNKNVF